MDCSRSFHVCLICGVVSRFSFFEGIFIRGRYICPNCEQVISGIEARDGYYQEVKDRLKTIWFDMCEKPYFS